MKKFILFGCLWVLFIVLLAWWSYFQEMKFAEKMIRNEALTHLARDKAFRYWASNHGGVYVPVTESLKPSPYLEHIPARDITTTDGMELTLLNPAWMLRQLMEEYEELYGVKGHITSLNPIREGNAPDQWEIKALKAFEKGIPEIGEFTEMEGALIYRYMTPLVTVDRCLKCHAFQGYETGDVRGGVSVSLSTEPYFKSAQEIFSRQISGFTFMGILGLLSLAVLYRAIVKKNNEKLIAERELAELEKFVLQKDKMATVDNLSAGMAHEINNPLAGMIQASSVLASRFDRKIDSRESRLVADEEGIDLEALKRFMEKRGLYDMLGIINEGGQRIAEVIKNLRAITAVASGDERAAPLSEYVRKALEMIDESFLNRQQEASRIDVSLRIAKDLPELQGEKLKQVLYNIILNSYQNLLEHDIKKPWITISAGINDHDKIRISIEDNGSGLSPEECKKAFDPFFTNRDVGQGKGLGLSVAYYIVTKVYSGEIIMESEPGKGSKVLLFIPVSPVFDGNSQ